MPSAPALLGNSTARPDSRMLPRSSWTSVARGRRPVKNSKNFANVSSDDTTCVCDWSGNLTFTAPPTCRSGEPSPHTASVGTPPGWSAELEPSRLT
ncbi:hypothetical protein [Microbispora rosea]|uniref:hypothetical protein n=1 Tax=Microbispora rosea TaxID=58117 RepID=UPI0034295120